MTRRERSRARWIEQLSGQLTRQTRTAVAAAAAFVAAASLLIVLPVPFVAWSPGRATDTLGSHDGTPLITVNDIDTYPTTGQLDLTTVLQTRVDSRLTFPEALISDLSPHRDVLPRESVYPRGTTAAQSQAQESLMMQTSQSNAVVAALRADGQPVTELPVVAAVTVDGPAYQRLQPGDLITAVDGEKTAVLDDVTKSITGKPAGSSLTFSVLRNRQAQDVTVTSEESSTTPTRPVVGITVATGYRYTPDISFDLGDQIGGPSAGLAFSLAIYDKITPGPLLDGRHVAGTGTISPDGTVGAIGGIQQKIAGAAEAGATVFLVPAPNCGDLVGVDTDLDLIKVDTLDHAIAALRDLDAGRTTELPRC